MSRRLATRGRRGEQNRDKPSKMVRSRTDRVSFLQREGGQVGYTSERWVQSRIVPRMEPGDRIVTAELVIPLAAAVIGARFGRLMAWPFPPRTSRWPRRINARYDLNNAMFWAILTCLVVNSAMTIIKHI